MEILGNNLYKFFSRIDPVGKYADITQAQTMKCGKYQKNYLKICAICQKKTLLD